ncbi:MAG: radical SAM protein [Bacteroidales bacterium]|nr:radical SAM protein [Bacteroidales bacterium]
MFLKDINYNEPVFRPPGEARSAILQATLGCSWNKCAFCEMYSSKKFKSRSFDVLKSEIETLAKSYKGVKKIFLADGNAFVLSANKLIPILNEINNKFGRLQRVSSYALPKDILIKSDSELKQLRELGLKLLYIGIETGDDELLKKINKGETFNSTVDGVLKAHNAGIDTSIMIINGLGGKKYSRQHALKSSEIINKVNPKFLSTLTLSLPYGEDHYQEKFNGEYKQQSIVALFEELKIFIENLNVENVIYRSDHISNNLILKGTLSKDKDELVRLLNSAIENTSKDKFPSAPGIL